MDISISLEGLGDCISAIERASGNDGKLQRALAAAGEVVRSAAAINAPVDTGYLAEHMTANVEGNSVVIGPAADYGIYVEFGTGSKGEGDVAHTSKKSWTYYKGGQFYTTSGQDPHPFLVPALKNNTGEIIRAFKEAFGLG